MVTMSMKKILECLSAVNEHPVQACSQELTGSCVETDEEVQCKTVADHGDKSDRNINECESGRIDKGVIHGCFLVPEDD